MSRKVVVAASALAIALAAAGCGKAEPANPYVTLDRAISVGWQQVTVNLGLSLDVPAQNADGFANPATAIHIDPSMLQATFDTATGRWQLATSVPIAALGITQQQLGVMGLNVQSIDVQVLFDGAALYAKSPLLPVYLQGALAAAGSPITGDLTGWVRLGSAADFQKIANVGMVGSLFGIRQGAALPLPSAGTPEALQAIAEDFGVALIAAGRESTDGLETEHLTATLNLAKLAESRTLAAMTGFGKDQLQSIFDAATHVAITSDLWADTNTGRLRTLRIDARTLAAPIVTVAVVVQLKEPAAGTSFDAPATFTDVPLLQLMGAGASGDFDGGGGTGGNEFPAPTVEIVGP